MSDSDWREGAYLRTENWPDAIPNCGPKREYGPYPWGNPTHDPKDADPYPHSHPDAASIGPRHLGDVCRWCGVPLSMDDEVVLINGERGVFEVVEDLWTEDDPPPAYHPDCYVERRQTVGQTYNQTLDEFA